MTTTIQPAFPNSVLTAAQQHALWELAGAACSDAHTPAQNLTWQLGTFSRLLQEATADAEREACAAIAHWHKREHYRIGSAITRAIRARSTTPPSV